MKTLSQSGYAQLITLLGQRELLPSLRQLSFTIENSRFQSLRTMLELNLLQPPCLQSLSLRRGRGYVHREAVRQALGGALSFVLPKCRRIYNLSIDGAGILLPPMHDFSLLVNLHSLKLTVLELSPELFQAFGHLKDLRDLDLTIETLGKPLPECQLNINYLPALQTLNVAAEAENLAAILECLSNENVHTAQLDTDAYYCSSNSISRQLRIGWNHIARFASLWNIEVRQYEKRDFRGPRELHEAEDLGSSIEAFLDLPHVREFKFFTRHVDALFFLSNETIIRMASSWPYLTVLNLNVVPNLKRNQSLATYKALEFLACNCPDLKELTIIIDLTVVPSPPHYPQRRTTA